MTIHPCLFPTLFAAAVSFAAAAILRRTVRKEYSSLLPWLWPWGILCAVPALLYAGLCLPFFAETADWLNASIEGTWMELLAGMAGVLPGLLWDAEIEHTDRSGAGGVAEANAELPFGLPAKLLRALLIAATAILILIPYGFLFR